MAAMKDAIMKHTSRSDIQDMQQECLSLLMGVNPKVSPQVVLSSPSCAVIKLCCTVLLLDRQMEFYACLLRSMTILTLSLFVCLIATATEISCTYQLLRLPVSCTLSSSTKLAALAFLVYLGKALPRMFIFFSCINSLSICHKVFISSTELLPVCHPGLGSKH